MKYKLSDLIPIATAHGELSQLADTPFQLARTIAKNIAAMKDDITTYDTKRNALLQTLGEVDPTNPSTFLLRKLNDKGEVIFDNSKEFSDRIAELDAEEVDITLLPLKTKHFAKLSLKPATLVALDSLLSDEE